MIIEIYHSKKDEQKVEQWMRFLQEKRGLAEFPDIPTGQPKLLAYHDGKEIYFQRDGLAIGHFVIEEYHPEDRTTDICHLPKFYYRPGNLADRIIDKPMVVD